MRRIVTWLFCVLNQPGWTSCQKLLFVCAKCQLSSLHHFSCGAAILICLFVHLLSTWIYVPIIFPYQWLYSIWINHCLSLQQYLHQDRSSVMSKTLTLQSSEVSLDFGVLKPRREGAGGIPCCSAWWRDCKQGYEMGHFGKNLSSLWGFQVTLNFYDRFRIIWFWTLAGSLLTAHIINR